MVYEMKKKKTQKFRKKGRYREPQSGGSEIGDMLRKMRVTQGWTLLDAEKETQLSRRIIAKLEKGGVDTSIKNLESYLNFYGLTLSVKQMEAGSKKEKDTSPKGIDEKGLPEW